MAKFVFIGNRFHVLDEMLKLELQVVKIFAVKNSYLERELSGRGVTYETIEGKKHLIDALINLEFDFLIANGLPVILPVSKLTTGTKKKFINIHPSYLPDLRGADPIPGAILNQRDSGVTCHYMNDQVDGGEIISQFRIRFTNFMDSVLLHQLSFEAERKVFVDSFERNFHPEKKQEDLPGAIYYTFRESDLRISFDDSPSRIVSRIKAFNNKSKGAFFLHKGEVIKVYDAEYTNDDLGDLDLLGNKPERTIAFLGEQEMIFRIEQSWVKFKSLNGDLSILKKGDLLV